MKWYRTRVEQLAVSAALCAAIGTVQAQEVPCRNLVGFASTPPDAIGPILTSENAFTGAWGAVINNTTFFSSNKYVTNSDGSQSCMVKVVTTPTLGKGKPQTTDYVAPSGLETPMTIDECSMYKYLSSVDSKMAQDKTSDALIIIGSMIEKIGKIQMSSEIARSDIMGAAEAVLLCIAAQ